MERFCGIAPLKMVIFIVSKVTRIKNSSGKCDPLQLITVEYTWEITGRDGSRITRGWTVTMTSDWGELCPGDVTILITS